MKKRILALLMSAICLTAAIPYTTVLADGEKVVTLGADLTEDQKMAILRYFGIAGQNIRTLTITNQDERAHLGSYVPLEQIGTRTYSCAFVNPTTSGGIQVKTANLSWVTSNMIASTLSTSGVVNCEVLAAAPFEVSGTGALTGILMAYESAVGTTLDDTKKEIATQELITTTTIADNIGQVEATNIVNETKIQVIQGNVVDQEEIATIVNDVAAEENIELTEEDRALISDLMHLIAEQDYDYEEMKDTLERVESNVQELSSAAGQTETSAGIDGSQVIEDSDVTVNVTVDATVDASSDASAEAEETEPETLAADSILMNTDDTALGESVIIDATNQDALAEETQPAEQPEASMDEIEGAEILDITTSDSYEEPAAEQSTETVADTSDGSETMEAAEAIISLSDMIFAPITSDENNFELQPAGLNELTVSFPRTDLAAGFGTLTVYNAADSTTYDTISMDDIERVAIEPLTAAELTEYGWTEGSKAVIVLNQPLAANSSYFVILSEGALVTSDGASHTEATQDSLSWVVQTTANGLTIYKDSVNALAGTALSGHFTMDPAGGAVYAAIQNVDVSIAEFSQYEYSESADFTVTLHQPGTTTFQVSYFDGAGTVLNTFEYTLIVK